MSEIPDVCDETAYLEQLCPKFDAPQHSGLFLQIQTHKGDAGSRIGTNITSTGLFYQGAAGPLG
jgi:hypothetical protein